MNILDQIDRISTSISTGRGVGGKGSDLSDGNNWWRYGDLAALWPYDADLFLI